ncbi:MAG: alanine--tRNA ligase [Xanthomonadales bacterium]|nr:alanine--tRNA ligase [Xanthomonadales bacterium]
MKTTAQIRQDFLDFFAARQHEVVASSSLVPADDPTLLFTNAGMVQFKDVFLGAEKRAEPRAASSQKCVRAGGKHNDLDQVGYTARHHTFFEMLGNFSFGDYFKKDAISFAWKLLTEEYGLEKDRLWVTVYHTDDEAFDLWKNDIGLADERIIRIGDKPGGAQYESDNFWAMGDTGPCGPCSEIFYDHGADYDGGLPGTEDEDGGRYVEIWNLVFMQFDRSADGSMQPLPKPCVDTGMGLERLAAVLQGVHSNYETDLFQALIKAAAALTNTTDLTNSSLNVIADHIRACAFLIADGILPSNEGRGYVLRRIIRRAIRHGFKLGQKGPFFASMTAPLVEQMGDAYPSLKKQQAHITATLKDEEKRFATTLEKGLGLLQNVMGKAATADGKIDGEVAFTLYDTYGFPLDLTQDIARENDLEVDLEGFDIEMEKQRARGRTAGQFQHKDQISADAVKTFPVTQFLGYEELSTDQATIAGILVEGQLVEQLKEGETAVVVLDKTPFYAESGGQVGDSGTLSAGEAVFRVEDTVKLGGTFFGHIGHMSNGVLKPDQQVSAVVDAERRQAIVIHHSATHLMHRALRDILGTHVEQKGSLVAPDYTRFDFSHPRQLSTDELQQIERHVNDAIRVNPLSVSEVMSFDDALKTGAMALFGEKYGDKVRVLRFGDLSTELCGGTHVSRVGEIGQFKIVSESAIGSGVRRIMAVAGETAVEYIQQMERQLQSVARELKVSPEATPQRLKQMLERNHQLEKDLTALKSSMASSGSDSLLDNVNVINGIKVLSARMDDLEASGLRDSVDHLKDRLGSAVVVLFSVDGDKVRIAAGVSKDLTARIKAGNLVNFVASQVGGKGGGRPDFAQAGGNRPDLVDEALASVATWVADQA